MASQEVATNVGRGNKTLVYNPIGSGHESRYSLEPPNSPKSFSLNLRVCAITNGSRRVNPEITKTPPLWKSPQLYTTLLIYPEMDGSLILSPALALRAPKSNWDMLTRTKIYILAQGGLL
jgi:hypothetical protein